MSPDDLIRVERVVTTRYVVDCPLCPFHEEYPAPVIAYYERAKHEETHADRP